MVFVRVTVCPSPEHDSTLYITFNKPGKSINVII